MAVLVRAPERRGQMWSVGGYVSRLEAARQGAQAMMGEWRIWRAWRGGVWYRIYISSVGSHHALVRWYRLKPSAGTWLGRGDGRGAVLDMEDYTRETDRWQRLRQYRKARQEEAAKQAAAKGTAKAAA